ncbi:glutamine amidotransferase subunit pdxT [Peziza echinospora]|nr:glutamine amidotransferase subunit pdxT [Peziza echinospora]
MEQDKKVKLTVGVLALQGAFSEHIQLLRSATKPTAENPAPFPPHVEFNFIEVRTAEQLASANALIIPGGESTTISLIAERGNMLEPLRDFVKLHKRPVWGTCAGMILLSERANRTKRGGQQLIGGLDVCVNRNHFGRQAESFECVLDMPFLERDATTGQGFRGVFIRAPVVERVLSAGDFLPAVEGANVEEEQVKAPHREGWREGNKQVEILAALSAVLNPEQTSPPNKLTSNPSKALGLDQRDRPLTPGIFGNGFGKDMTEDPRRAKEGILDVGHAVIGAGAEKPIVTGILPGNGIVEIPRGNMVAVRQGNVFGTSFHPELTGDVRMHRWWLGEVVKLATEQQTKTS